MSDVQTGVVVGLWAFSMINLIFLVGTITRKIDQNTEAARYQMAAIDHLYRTAAMQVSATDRLCAAVEAAARTNSTTGI